MKRQLWSMSDDQLWTLLERAEDELLTLNVKHLAMLAFYQEQKQRLSLMKLDSPFFAKTRERVKYALKQIDQLEQRIGGQRTFVQALRNESTRRNPPFWTQNDLDRMNRQR